MQPRLSVIIVNYNVVHFLEQCLRSVRRASEKISTQIIVVDNHSLDGSVEMVRRKFPEVTLIASEKNLGFSRGNNLGISQATGEYILLLNPDTVVQEDTFVRTLNFMDSHPQAGALGVKMIDGKGRFLPESKRGLPTPEVAFYKMFGLSALFPKSRRFGSYHLSYLDKEQTHEVDVLSGAFMLLRKSVLEQTGLLDETFFMYGEDIDLSYRIQLAGYKNYYFADTSIIHYKGESTKKTSVNYVYVFYKAMAIFARKHYSSRRAQTLSLLINLAIWLRASITLAGNVFRISLLAILDLCLFVGGFLILRQAYFLYSGKSTPELLSFWFFGGISFLWMLIGWLQSVYDRPISLWRFSKSMVLSGVLALVIYALLPESMRFSRAIVLSGIAWAWLGGMALRGLLSVLWPGRYRLISRRKKRFAVVGTPAHVERVLKLLHSAGFTPGFVARILPSETAELPPDFVANLGHLEEVCTLFSIDEVIFCADDISSQRIIEQMTLLDRCRLDFKIAPPESLFVIGSNSIHTVGELYFVLNINAISKPASKRNKRLFDIIAATLLLLTLPLWLFFAAGFRRRIANLWQVLWGSKTFVGYDPKGDNIHELPTLKPGLFSPSSALPDVSADEVARLNMLYAKDYGILKDVSLVFRGIIHEGRKL
jgi:GT2 family glycosyltransferase